MAVNLQTGEVTIDLTPDDAANVDRALRLLSSAQTLYDKAEACGVDCQQQRQLSDYLHGMLIKVKEHFVTPSLQKMSSLPTE